MKTCIYCKALKSFEDYWVDRGICKQFIDLTQTNFHIDHIFPISKGGMHGYINCQPAHPLCNIRKGAKI